MKRIFKKFRQAALLSSTALISSVSISFSNSISALEFSAETPERIKQAIKRYNMIRVNGGWTPVTTTQSALRLGDHGDGVRSLVDRLVVTNDLVVDHCSPDKSQACRFTHLVKDAVVRFQKRHGLKADGVVGDRTLAALNIPVERKLSTLFSSLDRVAQTSDQLDDRYVIVNIPSYTLSYFKNDKEKFRSRVIVGKKTWETPTMKDQIESFVVNPHWRLPRSIVAQEIAPKVARDPNYLESKNMLVLADSYLGNDIVDPRTINWSNVSAYSFPYFVTQQPGPKNPLGRVKYEFPNSEAIYIHDTAARGLFDREQRALSHGCIRIEKPMEFAHHLLDESLRSESMNQVYNKIAAGKTQRIRIPERVPVHLVYWTAWADESGEVHFRDDIYEKDIDFSYLINRKVASLN